MSTFLVKGSINVLVVEKGVTIIVKLLMNFGVGQRCSGLDWDHPNRAFLFVSPFAECFRSLGTHPTAMKQLLGI